ncbi:MAG: hypothetical protein O2985_08665 [Proteobacteria bacterium]|nr:hypothetical protein [Pseudomonadota bacterium]
MNRRNFVRGIFSIGAGATVAACVYDPNLDNGGPPPHAPAHGYRYRHRDGVDMSYDQRLGVYVVVGRPNYYYWDRQYFRYYGDHWQRSERIDSRWIDGDTRSLPPGLQRHRRGDDDRDDDSRGRRNRRDR